MTRSPRPTPEHVDLGVELRRVRTGLLTLTGPQMAVWLGVATVDSRGRPTSTGKSLVSRFESGARLPERAQIDQYAKAPGADEALLVRLWAAAGARSDTSDPPADAADPSDEPVPDARVRWRRVVVAVVAVAALATAGSVTWFVVRIPEPVAASPLTTPVPGATLVFDALGEQSDQTIRIFHGPGETESDRSIDGTYQDGQTAAVVCLTHGRRVTSDPSAGEAEKSSDEWARIVSSTGRISYASMTYATISPATAVVPPCEGQSPAA